MFFSVVMNRALQCQAEVKINGEKVLVVFYINEAKDLFLLLPQWISADGNSYRSHKNAL